MRSLRYRAILGGAVWAMVCVLVCGGVLYLVLERISTARFENALLERHFQVLAALERAGGDAEAMRALLTDPGFHTVYSGRYWQVEGNQDVATSGSLFDWMLASPEPASHEPLLADSPGPDGTVRVVRQSVLLQDGTGLVVSTAESLAALKAERGQLRNTLAASFGLVAVFGILGAVLQVTTALRPLAKLRTDVASRWDRGEAIDAAPYPDEVTPLIEDINSAIRRNREIVTGARRQAADLAHALKTPSAIMRNELSAAGDKPLEVAALVRALDRIDAQINRSLARMRASSSLANGRDGSRVHADLDQVLPRLVRAFKSLHAGSGKTLVFGEVPPAKVFMDRQDLEEVLGNILDNAFKWCRREVRLTVLCEGPAVVLRVEDDGPGIREEEKRRALVAGGRLDVQVEGTGLGLAIACDLVRAYDGVLELDTSAELGGLAVNLTLGAQRSHRPESPQPEIEAA